MSGIVQIHVVADGETQQIAMEGVDKADSVLFSGFEYLDRGHAEKGLTEIFQMMKSGAVLEFPVTNFHYVVEAYLAAGGMLDEIVESLCQPNRRCIWDEGTVAKALLRIGFYKVWTGQVSEYPKAVSWVKAMKLEF